MNKNFITAVLIILFLGLFSNLSAQESPNFSIKKKNTFSIGINYAINGYGDEISFFYKNEFTRSLNKYFDISAGVGFFNYADSVLINIGFQPNTITGYNSTSIVSFDFLAHLKIMDFNRHFFKFGIGYSLMKVKRVSRAAARSRTLENIEINTLDYSYTNGFDGSILVNLEYGFRVRPNFSTSISGRYYSEGKYVSLAMAGVNLSYSF